LLAIVERMGTKSGIEGLILGGTELPLLHEGEDPSFPFLDTTRIHAEAAANETLSEGCDVTNP
jgi:aspartate/glutamate racemase